MSNLSTAALVANEIAKVVDFSYANDQSINNITVALRSILTGENTDYVIGGKVLPYPSGGMNFIIEPIYGHCKASGIDVIDTDKTPQPTSLEAAHATMDRYDTVQIRGKEILSDYQQRKFKDPETGVLSTENIPTKKHIELEIMVKKGADGSVTAPLVDNGWVKLAEIFIPAGTVSITSDHINNITARAHGQENSAWTIEKSRTFNPGYLSEIIAKFLHGHNEDGTHKNNAIEAAQIKFGIEEKDVSGKNMPTGKSLIVRGEKFTSQVSVTTLIEALTLTLNAAFPYVNNILGRYSYIDDLPVATSTENVNIVTGGEMVIDGIHCAVGQMVFLKDQADKKQNGFWIVQTGAWNRAAGYTDKSEGCFNNRLILAEAGSENAGKVFYLENDTYEVGTDILDFKESIFSTIDLPGKIIIRDKNGRTIDDEKREKAIEGALLDVDSHPTMVDGDGRNLLVVLGVSTIPEAMAEIRRRCNNNGEINTTKIPNFRGIRIGDYIDGIDLSGVAVAPGGNAPQVWSEQYKNNRIIVSGFNTYKSAGDTENAKNHVLFTFRNVICQGRMRTTDTNDGGYTSADANKSEMRRWLEGAAGDGTGNLATKLKAELGGDYLYTIRKAHSIKSGQAWNSYTLWLPSELEVFGFDTYGDDNRDSWNTNIHLPIYQDGYAYKIKRFNGSRVWWWLMTPTASPTASFAVVYGGGNASAAYASNTSGGVAPCFCIA